MPTQHVPLEMIVANPWQTRLAEDPTHIQALADDIAERGLLQQPVGRLLDSGQVQLAFGHSRVSAIKLLHAKNAERWTTVDIDIRNLTDREMADFAAAENAKRKDLSAIEIAHALRQRIDDFSLSQAEAGKPFGLAQPTVANLLRLLKLPTAVQAHIAAGNLPERLARELITLAKVLPAEAIAIADQVAKVNPSERDHQLDSSFQETLRKKAKWLNGIPWNVDWPHKPIEVSGNKNLTQIPACTGCEFFVKGRYTADACLNAECFELKKQYATVQEVEQACKKLKIGLSAGEPTVLVFDGDGRQETLGANALATKHGSLRLAPHMKDDYQSYTRKRLLGSEWVELRTTDMAALKKAIAALPKQAKQAAHNKAQNDYERQQAQRRRDQAIIHKLYLAAAPHVAKALAWPEPILAALISPMASNHWTGGAHQIEQRAKASDTAGKSQLMAEIIIHQRVQAHMYSNVSPGQAKQKIEALAAELKVKLPTGWDAAAAPPRPAAKKAAKKKGK